MKMQVLMLAKQKGGAGASTIARELGVAAAADGLRIVFIDLDPQASLSKWWNRRTAGIDGEPYQGRRSRGDRRPAFRARLPRRDHACR